MAPTVNGAKLLEYINWIPAHIWAWLKSFVKAPTIVYSDEIYRLITRILPAAIMLIIGLNFGYIYFKNIDISCDSTLARMRGGGSSGGGNDWGMNKVSSGGNTELDNYCWNHGTFLVRKGLEPEREHEVTYPGVFPYQKGVDKLIRQRYYNSIWIGLGIAGLFAFIMNYVWKRQGERKVSSVMKVDVAAASDQETGAEIRAQLFNETVGFNQSFGRFYVVCKVLSTFVPPSILAFLRGFIGVEYTFYGVDVAVYWLQGSESWPSPLDVVFPLMAKCEWSKYGFSGDMEIESAQCQLPMNQMTRFTLFALWWILVILTFIAGVHLVFIVRYCCRNYRDRICRTYLASVCIDEVNLARRYRSRRGRDEEHDLVDVIQVRISFGDWLLLHLLKKNLTGAQFRNFIWQAANPDTGLQFTSGLRIRTKEEMEYERLKRKQRRLSFNRLKRSSKCDWDPEASAPAATPNTRNPPAGWVIPPRSSGTNAVQLTPIRPIPSASAAPGIQALQGQLLTAVNPSAVTETTVNSPKRRTAPPPPRPIPAPTATVAPGIQAIQEQLLTNSSNNPTTKTDVTVKIDNEVGVPSGPPRPRRPRCPELKPEEPPKPKPKPKKNNSTTITSVAFRGYSVAKGRDDDGHYANDWEGQC